MFFPSIIVGTIILAIADIIVGIKLNDKTIINYRANLHPYDFKCRFNSTKIKVCPSQSV